MAISFSGIVKDRWVQLVSASIVAFVGGYLIGQRTTRKDWDKAKEIIDELALFKSPVVLEVNGSVVEESEVENDDLEPDENDGPELDDFGEEVKSRVNVFTKPDDDWNWEAELSTRHPNAPYVIHVDEFINDEMGYQQETLTYYAGDDIMGDSDDTPIYNYQGLMGELKFGHGSKDQNVVYIRNEQIHMEWEILLHQGSFAEEVLGVDMEKEDEKDLKHSVLKFRRE